MRTRDVLKWHWSVRDMSELVVLVVGGLVLGILERAVDEVEGFVDRRANKRELPACSTADAPCLSCCYYKGDDQCTDGERNGAHHHHCNHWWSLGACCWCERERGDITQAAQGAGGAW